MSTTESELPVVFLLGPTASGKTAVAIELHKQCRCQLISVDSSLVYRGMDIGTAKPTAEEQSRAPHKLIDICDPWEPYSAARFCADAKAAIVRARQEQRVPVLTGGTMLYFKALEQGLATMPAADASVRHTLTERASAHGWEHLHTELATIDPAAAARIHPNDPQRIQRALEVWQLSGKTITEWQQLSSDAGISSPLIKCGLYPNDRTALHDRIAARFDKMLQAGFIGEVQRLKKDSRISAELPAMRSVGYRQCLHFLAGSLTEEEFRQNAITATRQLAKRQLTWMRGMHNLQRYDSLSSNGEAIVQQILQLIDEH